MVLAGRPLAGPPIVTPPDDLNVAAGRFAAKRPNGPKSFVPNIEKEAKADE